MVDGDRSVFHERNRVSDGVASFRDGGNSRDVIILLQRTDDCLHRRDVCVHLCAQLFEGGEPPV